MRIPLGLAAYQRLDLPPVYLKNLYYEKSPVNQKDQVALISRPALSLFANVGDGPTKGIFKEPGVISNRMLVVSNQSLYRVADDGTATLIGAVEGAFRMWAAGDASYVVFSLGSKLYRTDGASLTEITVPDSQPIYSVDYLNGRFLVSTPSGRFYWTEPGAYTLDALNYATAETKPDALYALRVVGDVLWLFGPNSIEPWAPTDDADLPFRKISGRAMSVGVRAGGVVRRLRDTLFWLGSDDRVYRASPEPEVISDTAVEERIASTPDATQIYSLTFSFGRHDFYCLQIPEEGTFAYDATTGLWGEWTSYGEDLFRVQYAATTAENRVFLGDINSNAVWEFSATAETDGSDPIVYEWTGLVEGPGVARAVKLDASYGTTTDPEDDPTIQMRLSHDGGHTWDDWLEEYLGRQGEFGVMATWSRLGQFMRRLLFHWRTTKRLTVRGADLNEGLR